MAAVCVGDEFQVALIKEFSTETEVMANHAPRVRI
jgi:hypothetical protein